MPRIGRVLDLVAALIFAGGAAFYAWSWIGLRDIDQFVRPEGRDTFATLTRANELSLLGRIGIGLMIAAGVTGVVSAVVARRIAARET